MSEREAATPRAGGGTSERDRDRHQYEEMSADLSPAILTAPRIHGARGCIPLPDITPGGVRSQEEDEDPTAIETRSSPRLEGWLREQRMRNGRPAKRMIPHELIE
jgi:hypothetical protein